MENQNRITINEKGFIRNLLRLGFTKNQSFAEILTNSIDAKASKIIIQKGKKEIRIIDNGLGMNESELRNKYDLMKQRTRTKETTGCAGIGGTTSEFILAKKKSIVITKKANEEEIFVAEVDWNRVYTEQKLFDSIQFRSPTAEEIESFNSERDGHGTTTILYFSDQDNKELSLILEEQFDRKKKKDIPHCERFDIIFGHKNCEFVYKHWKHKKKEIVLDLYNLNYYREESNNYMFQEYDIEILRENNSGELIYISNGRIIDVHGSTSRGKKKYKTSLTNYIKNCETTRVGMLKLNLYNPYDESRFDTNNPKMPGASQSLNAYEKNFFRPNEFLDREFIQEMQIYRNNHYLGIKKIFNRNSGRADGKSANKLFYTRSFIEFFVESKEDEIEISPVDDIFGIQLNKNQNNQDNLPIPLGRLIEGLIEEFHMEVWTYFQTTIDELKRHNEIITKKSICDELFTRSKVLTEGPFNAEWESTINTLTTCILDLKNYPELNHYIKSLGNNKNKLSSKLLKYKSVCQLIEKEYYKNIKNPILISDLVNKNLELLEPLDKTMYLNLDLTELKLLIKKLYLEKKKVEEERLALQEEEERLALQEEEERLALQEKEKLTHKTEKTDEPQTQQKNISKSFDRNSSQQEILKDEFIAKIQNILWNAKKTLEPDIYQIVKSHKFNY